MAEEWKKGKKKQHGEEEVKCFVKREKDKNNENFHFKAF